MCKILKVHIILNGLHKCLLNGALFILSNWFNSGLSAQKSIVRTRLFLRKKNTSLSKRAMLKDNYYRFFGAANLDKPNLICDLLLLSFYLLSFNISSPLLLSILRFEHLNRP